MTDLCKFGVDENGKRDQRGVQEVLIYCPQRQAYAHPDCPHLPPADDASEEDWRAFLLFPPSITE